MEFRRREMLAAFAGAALPLARPTDARAAEDVLILAAGAVKRPVEDVVAVYRTVFGREVRIITVFDTVGALRDRVLAGETPDLLLLSEAALNELKSKGKLDRNWWAPVGRVGIGLCAARDAPALDISTPEKLKSALLAAKSIAHADPARGATAGTHFRKVLADLGVLEQLASRIVVVPFGAEIPGRVARGEFAIGVSQASEIVPVKEVRFAGYLPPPHDLWTSYGLSSVKGPGHAQSAAARLWSLLLSEREGAVAFRRAGFER